MLVVKIIVSACCVVICMALSAYNKHLEDEHNKKIDEFLNKHNA